MIPICGAAPARQLGQGPSEKASHPFHLRVAELILLLSLAQVSTVPSKEKKEAKSPGLMLIQDYNAFNRSPEGLNGWINHQQAFLCRKNAQQQHKKKKRLIDRGEETALSGGEKGGRGGRQEEARESKDG